MVKIVLELLLYCALFFLVLKVAVGNDGKNMLYFYPKAYQKKAVEIGLAGEKELKKKRNLFMTVLAFIMLAALIIIIAFCNHVKGFKTAYMESLIFLEAMNWFDGMLDKVWIGYSRIWVIPEMDGMPYVSSWKEILKKRLLGTVLFLGIASFAAWLIVLIGRFLK